MNKGDKGREINRTTHPTPHIYCSLPIALCSLLIVLSCQTAPKIADTVPEEDGLLALGTTLPLNTGAFAYIVADVQNAMPVLNQTFLGNMKLQQMLDSTSWAMVAVFAPNNEVRYQLVAWGSYPASRARMALGLSRDWKKRRSEISRDAYWYSAKEGLSIALNRHQARITAGIPAKLIDPFLTGQEAAIPPGFSEFSKGAVLACWINDSGELINAMLREMDIPIEIPAELLFIKVESIGEDQYQASLRIQVSSAAQARALVTVLTIAKAFLSPGTDDGGGSDIDSASVLLSVLFANPPVQDGNTLNLKTNILSSREVALLFNIFSL
jgi:hypothetical protein